jgi:CP family cyanate transporter-like MFS transporter
MPTYPSQDGPQVGGLARPLWLLFIAGVAMRMTLLVMPPVIPLVHDDLHMSETQVGLLVGLPLAVFAVAAVPGSLLIARIGATLAVTLGMAIAAIAGGARAAAVDVWTLYAAAIVSGFGIALMQPGMPTLVRDWLPKRIAFGTIGYSAGMLMGATFPAVFTIGYVLPAVGGSWRLDVLLWALPAILIAPVFLLLSPKKRVGRDIVAASMGRWWPDWKNPVVWMLGFTFASNNSPYFVTSAFLGDYLVTLGKPELLGSALGWLNGSQIVALAVLFLAADRLHMCAWPFLVFGPLMLVAFLVIIFVHSSIAIIAATAVIGIAAAVTMTAILALPAFLSRPGDVPRTAAGMFTVSYTCAIIIPTICGALWDLTGRPWTAFVPLCICAVALTVLGTIVTRFRLPTESGPADE